MLLLFFYEGTYVVVADDLVNTGSIGGCLELYSLRILLELSFVFLDQFNNLLPVKCTVSFWITKE